MALREATLEEGTLEECLDEINDFVQTLFQGPFFECCLAKCHRLFLHLREDDPTIHYSG